MTLLKLSKGEPMKHVIELTDQQRNNLLQFLSRVEMKGNEAVAWVELVQLLNNGGVNNGDDQ